MRPKIYLFQKPHGVCQMQFRSFFLFLFSILVFQAPLLAGDKVIALQAANGKWVESCVGCLNVTVPQNPDLPNQVVLKPGSTSPSPQQLFTLQDAGDGKVALRGQNNRYFARCAWCVVGGTTPDFIFAHVPAPQSPQLLPAFAKFQLKKQSNGKYTLQADTGKYVAWCNGCAPNSSVGDVITIHEADPSKDYAQWTFKDMTPPSPPSASPYGQLQVKDGSRIMSLVAFADGVDWNNGGYGYVAGQEVSPTAPVSDAALFEKVQGKPRTELGRSGVVTWQTSAYRSKKYPNVYLHVPDGYASEYNNSVNVLLKRVDNPSDLSFKESFLLYATYDPIQTTNRNDGCALMSMSRSTIMSRDVYFLMPPGTRALVSQALYGAGFGNGYERGTQGYTDALKPLILGALCDNPSVAPTVAPVVSPGPYYADAWGGLYRVLHSPSYSWVWKPAPAADAGSPPGF
jgi:hypothetical protein